MKRNVGIALVLLCVLGVVAWQMRPKAAQPTPTLPPPIVNKIVPEPTHVEPPPEQVAPALPPVQPQADAAPSPEPQAAPEVAKDDPFGGKPITVETLTGCKEVQQLGGASVTIEYARNGEWKVNGNSRAKWTIEGNRVKIYKDGTDEVHYVDIVNNKLVYNGKEIAMTR